MIRVNQEHESTEGLRAQRVQKTRLSSEVHFNLDENFGMITMLVTFACDISLVFFVLLIF